MSRFLLIPVLAIAVLALMPRSSHAVTSTVPCSDPRGCPDMTVDQNALGQNFIDTFDFAATDCAVQEGSITAGTRTILEFTTISVNQGKGDLILGAPAAHPEWFTFDPCHNHYHFIGYADYRLWTSANYSAWQTLRKHNPGVLSDDLLAANPSVAPAAKQSKIGFCLLDSLAYTGRHPTNPNSKNYPNQTYDSCATNQGISAGWGDSYQFYLIGQWIDITGLASGSYVLEAESNPAHKITESNYANKSAAITVSVP